MALIVVLDDQPLPSQGRVINGGPLRFAPRAWDPLLKSSHDRDGAWIEINRVYAIQAHGRAVLEDKLRRDDVRISLTGSRFYDPVDGREGRGGLDTVHADVEIHDRGGLARADLEDIGTDRRNVIPVVRLVLSIQNIGPRPATNDIGTGAAFNRVMATLAGQAIIVGAPLDAVVHPVAIDDVVTITGSDGKATARPPNGQIAETKQIHAAEI